MPDKTTEETPVPEVTPEETPAKTVPAETSAAGSEVLATTVTADLASVERERCKKIRALCELAGTPDKFNTFVDNNFSVEETQVALRDIVAKKNPSLSQTPEAPADPNAKYKAEFAAEPAYAKSMTVEQFVAMRRVDDGLDILKAPMNSVG